MQRQASSSAPWPVSSGARCQLPVRIDRPQLAAQELAQPQARVRTILSAPVYLAYGPGGWKLPRWRLAQMLALPKDGSTAIRIAGPAATKFFAAIQRTVDQPAKDASFAILTGNRVRVVPSGPGSVLDAAPTARGILAAALRPTNRIARVRVRSEAPEVTTKEAKGMGINGLVGAYETIYGGEANRLHNVRLVARLIDGKLIAPGTTFSFNDTTGERSEDKGFLEAPVIINGELQTGLGGGVCQVSTTVFNAAYEAGLAITSRTNHALYISHYPLARDATVNYPDTDLKFKNDTDSWLLVKTFVGSSSLTVALYGEPQNRRVESEVAPLVVRGPAPVKQISDPSIFVGSRVTVESGSPARSTSVRRKVYSSSGELLYNDSWSSFYRGEHQVIRVGTKPKPKAPPRRRRRRRSRRLRRRRRRLSSAAAFLAGLGLGDGLGEPGRHACWPVVSDGDAGMRRPAVGDDLSVVALDLVVEPEARAADVAAASVDLQVVVESGRRAITRVRLEREGVDSLGAQDLVAASEPPEVLDAGDLEPDQVLRVVRDALRVGLREADGDLGREVEGHAPTMLA